MNISDLNQLIEHKIVRGSITRCVGTESEKTVESRTGYFHILSDDSDDAFVIFNSDKVDGIGRTFGWNMEGYTKYSIEQYHKVYTINILLSDAGIPSLEQIKFEILNES